MLVNVVAQIPPTLTPFPVATALVDIPSFGLWEPAKSLLQFWNGSGVGTGAQYILLGGVIILGVFVFVHYIRQLGGKDDQ